MGPGPPPQRPPLGPPVRQGSSGGGSSRRLSGAAGLSSPSPRTALSDTRPGSGNDGRGSTLPPSPRRRQPTPPSGGYSSMASSPGTTSTLPDLARLSLSGSSSSGMGLSRSGSGSRGRGAMASSPAGPVRPTEPIMLSEGHTPGPRVRRSSKSSATTAQPHDGPSPSPSASPLPLSLPTTARAPGRPPSPRLLPSLRPPSPTTSTSTSTSHKALVPYTGDTQVDAAGRLAAPPTQSQPQHQHQPSQGADVLSTSSGGVERERERERGGLERVPSPEVRRLVGLQNLGNTCFMNSCLQCLLSAKSLTRWLCEGRHASQVCSGSPLQGQLVSAYASLAQAMCSAQDHTAISPAALKKVVGKWAPHFSGYEQQDSQEFLRFLLDGLSEDLNRATPEQRTHAKQLLLASNSALSVPLLRLEVGEVRRQGEEAWARFLLNNNSVITDLFCGQLQSRVQCTVCQRSTLCFDAFMDISLPLPKGSEVLESRSRSRAPTPQTPTPLAQCLDTFTAQETLDGDERVRCEHCQSRCVGLKTLAIQRFPPLLVLHIKRFRYTPYAREKLATPLDFPLNGLDLRPYAANGYSCTGNALPPIYDLYAVSNHIGGMGGGHYTAHCRSGSQWYSFNDSLVSCVSPSSLSGAQAYVLFYAQRTTPNAAL